MAIGNFGVVRPADVNINDIDIFYNYSVDRETLSDQIFRLNPEDVLSEMLVPEDEQIVDADNLLNGLYNLRLPAEIFDELGIYTIYIKPKTLEPIEIYDCSVLSALPTVKGIVIREEDLPEELRTNNALQGFRVEYMNPEGIKLRNVVRHVVTSNRVIPVTENIGNTSQTAVRYRFDDNGSLFFLQLTPSSSSDVKPNLIPYIGNPEDQILLSNTYFSPLVIEVEMVENTIDTIADIVGGEQIKDVNNGILTYYDKDRNITKQFNLFEIKDDVTDVSLYEVKEKRENIDETQDFDDITSEVE